MRSLLLSIIFFLSFSCWGEVKSADVYNLPIPRNLDQCFKILGKTLNEEETFVIKTYQEDSIYYHKDFKYGASFFHAWKLYDGSILTKYFNNKGLVGSHEIYNVILISYHRYLNQITIDLDGQIKKYIARQKADFEEYLKKMDKDTIDGVYIPKNIEDCFNSLNKVLKNTDIKSIKSLSNREETIIHHHGLGQWIRNNWGLWSGSRLQKYLMDRNLTEPDGMSSKILEFYYDWLNGKNDSWMKFDKKK